MQTVRETLAEHARGSVLWLALALAIVAGTVWVIGIEDVTAALEETTLAGYARVVALVGGITLSRALALQRVLAVLDQPVSLPRALALQLAAVFSNNVTPSGQAGGVPVAGLFVARGSGTRYETSCAAVLSVNLFGSLALLVLGLFGAGVLVATAAVGETLRVAMLSTVGMFLLLFLSIAGIWVARERVRAFLVAAFASAGGVAGRVPGLPAIEKDVVTERVDGFGTALVRVARGPRREVTLVVVAVTLAHLFAVSGLSMAFRTVGLAVSPALLLVVLPLAYATATAPFPGGLGSIEATLTALIVAASPGLAAGAVGAAVLVFRSVTFWLQTLVGAIAGAVIALVGR